MKKAEILKQMGFSDSYLKSLEEYEKITPVIEVVSQFESDWENVTMNQDSVSFNVVTNNDDYSKNLIVRVV